MADAMLVYVPRVLLGNVESFGERAGFLLLPSGFAFGGGATGSQVGKRRLEFCEKVLCRFLRASVTEQCQRRMFAGRNAIWCWVDCRWRPRHSCGSDAQRLVASQRSAAQQKWLERENRVGFFFDNIPIAKHREGILLELQRQAVAQQRKTMR